MRRVPLLAALALVLGLATARPARADRVYIDVTGATFRPYPLAIPRVLSQGDAAAKVADLVTARLRYDLDVSGVFQVLDPRSFLAAPGEGLNAASIKFPAWANVGAEGLLKGRITVKNGIATYEAHLFDVTKAEESAHWTYTAPVADARMLAHRCANDVVKYFTGERGIFDTSIAFVRRVGKSKEVWVGDWDGHGAHRLTGGGLNLLPAWAPDGSRVAYTSYRTGYPKLYTVSLSGHVSGLVTGGGEAMYTGVAFSPDGRRIAYTDTRGGNSQIWVANADGSHPRELTHAWGVDASPSFSPDGKRIAFVSSRGGSPQIYVMNADGTGQKRLTFQGNYNQTPAWSPRGDAIAFTARDERNVFDLFTVSPDTGDITRLTQDTGNNEEPSYSPDGHHIVFTSTRTGHSRIWIMNADGTNQRMLQLPKGSYYTPVWGPYPAGAGPAQAATAAPSTPPVPTPDPQAKQPGK